MTPYPELDDRIIHDWTLEETHNPEEVGPDPTPLPDDQPISIERGFLLKVGLEPDEILERALRHMKALKLAQDDIQRRIDACPIDDYRSRCEVTGATMPTQGRYLSDAESEAIYLFRDNLTREYAWGIPTQHALETIAKYAPILELGAGSGYWAYLLRKKGVDILAYDRSPPSLRPKRAWHGKQWTGVVYGRARKAAKHPDRTLLLCWPPQAPWSRTESYRTIMKTTIEFKNLRRLQRKAKLRERPAMAQERFSFDALAAYRGEHVIYIGEPEGGVTATREFFALLARDWECIDQVTLPHWRPIRDDLFVYRRKE
jgi:SAM-dependent methyltransferase